MSDSISENFPWTHKISNAAQLGGIETSIVDNGPGRGTRIAWVNTGAGLRYKVVIDRAMDIGEAFYNQHSLAWLSHSGITSPEPFSDSGTNWLRTFSGGLLTTCGLSHIGTPDADATGARGLHGRISNIPAELESVIQPNPAAGRLEMAITGRILETKVFGPTLELKRTIKGTLGKPSIVIHDEVRNLGNSPAPHMQLYHCNFGWPLVDEGTDIVWNGKWQLRGGENDKYLFEEENDFKKCPAPTAEHNSSGEAVGFIDAVADSSGLCVAGLYNSRLSMAVALRFYKAQLPCLTNWQHWGKGEYVTGLEPGTNHPIGQVKAKEQNALIYLLPGETRVYDLEIEVLTEEEKIKQFLNIDAAR